MQKESKNILPIIFNTEMVRALLEGRKTVARRVVKLQPEGRPVPMKRNSCWPGYFAIEGTEKVIRPPYKTGDILWVLETWSTSDRSYLYRAWPGNGMEPDKQDAAMREMGLKWRSPYHMPWEAARIFLRVTGVRVERLRDMVLADVLMEGITEADTYESTWNLWHQTWDSTIKPKDRDRYGWAVNPWVWVIGFERITKKEAEEHG